MAHFAKQIALTLKSLRQQRGWSLDKTAQETGVSKAMLGQIERGESSPTVATLWKIAGGFQTSFSSFLETSETKPKSHLYRSKQIEDLIPINEKMRITPLFPFDKQLNCEIFIIELLPSCEHLSLPHKTGIIEHIIVAEGRMEVLIGKKWRKLQKGEGLRFNADQAHGYRNVTHTIARIHNIIHYPS